MSLTRQGLVLGLGVGLWLLAVTGAMGALWAYGTTPGTPARPPSTWPAESPLVRESSRPTLLLFAHPHCPCTRASVEELDRLLASIDESPQVRVLVAKPDGTPPGWEASDLWQRAAAIPGVTVTRDDGGREAQRFGSATSGQVLLYDAAGDLRFAGGITPSRGHEGDSAGRAALRELLSAGRTSERTTPVFGCALAAAGAIP